MDTAYPIILTYAHAFQVLVTAGVWSDAFLANFTSFEAKTMHEMQLFDTCAKVCQNLIRITWEWNLVLNQRDMVVLFIIDRQTLMWTLAWCGKSASPRLKTGESK